MFQPSFQARGIVAVVSHSPIWALRRRTALTNEFSAERATGSRMAQVNKFGAQWRCCFPPGATMSSENPPLVTLLQPTCECISLHPTNDSRSMRRATDVEFMVWPCSRLRWPPGTCRHSLRTTCTGGVVPIRDAVQTPKARCPHHFPKLPLTLKKATLTKFVLFERFRVL